MSDGEDQAGVNEAGRETAVRRDRFSGGPAREFLSSLDADERIFHADLAVDRAHVVMLAEQGIVDDETVGDSSARPRRYRGRRPRALPDGEDVQEAIESAVIDRVGPNGGRCTPRARATTRWLRTSAIASGTTCSIPSRRSWRPARSC